MEKKYTGQRLLAKIGIHHVPTWVFLWSAALIYTFAYFANSALPGNNPAYPEGWWGWFDQSQYLLSAKSWLAHDFAPGHHYYPPLYPLIGAVFYQWMPAHPYFLFDGAAFVGFVYVFMRFASCYVSRIESLLIICFAVYFNRQLIVNFVIPWTTAGTIAIYSITILVLLRLASHAISGSFRADLLRAFGFSTVFGLLVILRPVDAGLAAVFFPGYLWLQHDRNRHQSKVDQAKSLILTGASLGLGLMVGLALFAIYNKHVFGNVLGGYITSTAQSSGYFISELPRKAFSLLFDANTFFLEPGASIVSTYPWVLLSIAGLIVFIFRGDALLRILALAMIFHFCLYAPYGDLLPNGVWRFKNIHYFKWMFPYLMLFGWLLVRWMFVSSQNKFGSGNFSVRTVGIRIAAVGVLCLTICSLRFIANETSAESEVSLDQASLEVKIHALSVPKFIDFIDLQGMEGGFTEIYFGQHRLTVDGRPLSLTRDFRLVPAPWGTRLLFIHPVNGREIIFDPAAPVKASSAGIKAFVGSYHLSMGMPKLKHDVGCPMAAPVCS